MNPLTLIPAKVRLGIYGTLTAAGIGLSSVALYFPAVGSQPPHWLAGAAAVLGGLVAPFAAMAGSNVTATSPAPTDSVNPQMGEPVEPA